MTNKLKTLLLTSTLVLPIALLTSCSTSDNETETKTISGIEKKALDNGFALFQKDINNNPIRLTTLQKLFNGLDQPKFNKINVKLSDELITPTSKHTITLTAKTGYQLFDSNGKVIKSIVSKEFNVIQNLNITSKTPETIYEDDITTNLQTDSTINKLFTLSNPQDFNKVTIKLQNSSSISAGSKNKVILTPKIGYIFEDGTKELLSQEFIITKNPSNPKPINGITLNPSSLNPINEKDINNNPISLTTLQKLFNGLDQPKFNKINVKLSDELITPTSKHTITLTAKTGYQLFDSNGKVIKSIVSKEFNVVQNLNITSKTPETIYEDDITTNLQTDSTINKLFTLSNPQDFDKVTIKLQNSSPTSAGSKNKVILTPKIGYIFEDGTKELLSQEFTIVKHPTNLIPIDGITLNPSSFNSLNERDINNNPIRLTTLQKLFNGLDQPKLNKINVKLSDELITPTSKHTITLAAKIGYELFDSNGKVIKSIVSKEFNVVQNLNILLKTPEIINEADITTNLSSKETINKLFTLSNPQDFDKVTIKLQNSSTSSGSKNKVILTPKIGYIFENGNKELLSQEFTINGLSNSNLIITPEGEVQGFVDPKLNDGTLAIKESYNGIIVKRIGSFAFENNKLTSLTLPDSITSIGISAFKSNGGLRTLVIPDSVIEIEKDAFESCTLTSLTLGNSITTIGDSAFWRTQITSLIIPDSVTSIGISAFLFNELTSLKLGNSITTIGKRAFGENKLTSLIIPNSVTTIGEDAFKGNNLISLTIPDSVTTIGNNAFGGSKIERTKLTLPSKFNTPEEFERIGITLSDDLDNLIITPEGEVQGFIDLAINDGTLAIKESYNGIVIKKIATKAFASTNLTSINIPNSVEEIGNDAFGESDVHRNNLTLPSKFDTPTEIKRIGITLNYNSENLKITPEGEIRGFVNPDLNDGTLVIKESYNGIDIKKIAIKAFADNKLTSLTIPNSVTTIGSRAFQNNNLISLTIPDSVTTIGDYAFLYNEITDRNNLILPSNFYTPEELQRIGINLTSSKEILLTSNSLNNYNNLMKVITVTNKFKIK